MHRTVFTLRPVGALAIMIIMTLAVVGYAYIATQPEGSADVISDALPQVKGKITVTYNDSNAVFTWNKPAINKAVPLNNRHSGFVVVYNDKNTPENKFYKTTTADVNGLQIQALAPNVTYEGQVYTINSLGQVGLPSETFTFRSDNSGTLALQKQFDEGELIFFDPMNEKGEGAPNEKLWNIAGGTCNNTKGLAGVARNLQAHGHIAIASESCDRGKETMLMRGALLDLTDNGTRKLGMTGDFGINGPGAIYFTISEEAHAGLDQPLRINPEGFGKDPDGLAQAYPNVIEFSIGNRKVGLKKTDASGVGRQLASAELAKFNIPSDSNLQLPIELSFNPNVIKVNINGQEVLSYSEKNLMSATKHGVAISGNTYNENKLRTAIRETAPPQISIAKVWHFDQVYLTAAPNQIVSEEVHNYKNFGNFQQEKLHAGSSITLSIPDPVIGKDNKLAKQKIKGIMAHTDKWAQSDVVTINGKSYVLPNPKNYTGYPNIPDTGFINAARGLPFALEVDSLKTGENKISFSSETRSMDLINVHAELTFQKNQAPVYTQPSINQPVEVNQLNFNTLGPDEALISIGSLRVGGKEARAALFDKSKALLVPSNSSRFVTKISGYNSRAATGAFPNIIGAELSIDGVTVATKRLDADFPPPEATAYLDFDTANLASGVHEVRVKAYSKNCVLGRTTITHAQPGVIKPYFIKVENKNTVNKLQPVTPICSSGESGTSTVTSSTSTKKYKMDAQPPALLHHLASDKLVDPNNVIEPDADVTDTDEDVDTL